MTEGGTSRLQRSSNAVFRRLRAGAGGVLLNLDTGEYRQINESGALIWTLLEGGPTRAELIRRVREAVSDPSQDVDADVDRFLDQLAERGLLSTTDH